MGSGGNIQQPQDDVPDTGMFLKRREHTELSLDLVMPCPALSAVPLAAPGLEVMGIKGCLRNGVKASTHLLCLPDAQSQQLRNSPH